MNAVKSNRPRRQRERVDLDAVRVWCAGEGGEAVFEELIERLDEDLEPR